MCPPPRCKYVFYILQYLHLDLRRDLVQNIHGIVIYISYHDYVFSLQMAFLLPTIATPMTVRPRLPLDHPPETGIGGMENKKVTSKRGYRYQRVAGEARISCR